MRARRLGDLGLRLHVHERRHGRLARRRGRRRARLTPVYLRGAQIGRLAPLFGIARQRRPRARRPAAADRARRRRHDRCSLRSTRSCMPETGFRPTAASERGSLAQMLTPDAQGAGSCARGRRCSRSSASPPSAACGASAYDRLWQAHLIRDVGLPELGGLDPVRLVRDLRRRRACSSRSPSRGAARPSARRRRAS